MQAKELATKLLEYPEFEVCFSFCEKDNSEWGMTVRRFKDIDIDIGCSDKIISLGGIER
jgi:hypothetical protein